MSVQTLSVPFAVPFLNEDTRLFFGSIMKFHIRSQHTNREVAVIEASISAGSEPPRHVHNREDETFILKSGEVSFYVGDKVIHAKAGDIVFAPRKVPHHFTVTSPQATWLVVITPGHFDQFFWELSTPIAEDETAVVAPPSEELVIAAKWLADKYGVHYV